MANVTLFDDESLRIDSLCNVSKDFIISDFLYGHCHIFALALSLYFGDKAKCHCIIDYDEKKPCLAHAYVSIDGNFVDARGVITSFDIDQYTDNLMDFEYYDIEQKDLIENAKDDSWGFASDELISDILIFIDKNKEIYSGQKIDDDILNKYIQILLKF